MGREHSLALMVQGTSSNAGKSLLTTALCRIFHRRGFSVCPFKAQNMTPYPIRLDNGMHMSSAQVLQAFAAGTPPDIRMNPVMLVPQEHMESQVYFLGKKQGRMSYREFTAQKRKALSLCQQAYQELAQAYDLIILEGAGSPAEINLQETDIVNMAAAHMADAKVLLVGDIDRGGVFAHLYGTYQLLAKKDRQRIKGFVLNNFRGDPTLLTSACEEITQKTKVPFLATIPHLPELGLPPEDSLGNQAAPLPTNATPPLQDNQARNGLEASLNRLADAVEEAFGEKYLRELITP